MPAPGTNGGRSISLAKNTPRHLDGPKLIMPQAESCPASTPSARRSIFTMPENSSLELPWSSDAAAA